MIRSYLSLQQRRGARTNACSVHTFQKPSGKMWMPKRFVGQVGRGTLWVRPIINRPVMWGSQSWLMPRAFCNGINAARARGTETTRPRNVF
jgi:hypothetical protein